MKSDICVSSGRKNPLEKDSNSTSSVSLNPRTTGRFRELVGCLMWLANQTRPDIAKQVRAVARYTNLPRKVQWRAAVGVFAFTPAFDDEHLIFGNVEITHNFVR